MSDKKRTELEIMLRDRKRVVFAKTVTCTMEENWVSSQLGDDYTILDGTFTAAELRMLADYAEGKRPS